jgi:hypothetical protein
MVSRGILVPGPEEQTRRPLSSRSDTQERTPVSSAGGLAESSERKGFRRSPEHEPDGHDQHGVSPHVMVVCPRSTRSLW